MQSNRRDFIKGMIAAGAAPVIVPSSVFGAAAPSNKVQVAIIGCGRIGTTMELGGCTGNQDVAMLTTICDVDRVRMEAMKVRTGQWYKHDMSHLKLEQDYRKVLDDPGIDGVMICTPDHWHARMSVEACLKGKDVYVQKPMALSVEESQAIAEAVRRTKRVFHIGTQQRGQHSFRQGVECVMSGRIGKLKTIDVELPLNNPDREWNVPAYEKVPDKTDFDFDMWLGPARDGVPYSQLRTHWRPVDANGRPYARVPGQNVGWLQIQDYCTGNIGGWGSHHIDIAQWAMGSAGPISVRAEKADFLSGRMFNVHHEYVIVYKYANGVELRCASRRYSHLPTRSGSGFGVRFTGENGDWIWTSRGSSSIPEGRRVDTAHKAQAEVWYALEANKKEVIAGEPEKHAVRNPFRSHHRPWFLAMRERKDTHITVEEANVSTLSCILGYHAMNNVGYEIKWDPVKRAFVNPADAAKFTKCSDRRPYSTMDALEEIRKRG
jgi:predicted dehydrogenase